MKKKLLVGILALALCSANMPQTIFAGEFTSGNPEEVSEETSEIFTDNDQESAEEELSVFASESVPEFSNEINVMPAAADGTESITEIDLTKTDESPYYNPGDNKWKITSGGSYKFIGTGDADNPTNVPIIINPSSSDVVIYLNNVYIRTVFEPALDIQSGNVNAYIYLENNNQLVTTENSPLKIGTLSSLTIKNSFPNNNDRLTVESGYHAGIDSNSPLTISGGSVIASSLSGVGISNNNLLTISGGSVTASSQSGAGISNNSSLTISGGSVIASSQSGAGISNNSSLTISGGSVAASSLSGVGISNNSNSSLAINGGSVAASSFNGDGIFSNSNSSLTINRGSVTVSSLSGSTTPKNADGIAVYCCTISNPQKRNIKIDNNDWITYNHVTGTNVDDNMYAWLPGESHTITVGNDKRTYSFDNNQFIRKETNPTADQFDYTQLNFKYTKDTPVDISKYIKWKDDVTGHGEITKVTYFKKVDGTSFTNSPTDAGTYTFKIDVNKGDYYNSAQNISASPEWEFVISKAQAPSNKPTKTTISVPWSCKKVNEIDPNPLPANWEWQGSDKTKDLNVGDNTATAVYTGEDANKGNYNTINVAYTITREACTHPHTTERYYSSPSCTSSGYSGDTYCTDCGVLVSSGYTISAYGHDYDNGIITTEPTAETDGIITYTCKWCKHQDTKTLGKLGDGEPYIEGSFQKKGWDAVNDLIKASKEKDTISIILNGAKILPASVLSEIKGKDISLNLDMENGFIWKINGTSITSETPADTDLSVTNTAEYIPAALYSLISTNQNDFGFHLGRSGAFDFPAVLSVKADASCAGLMANLFWYDVENGVLQCIQTVTVGGAFERSIPYADFTLSKGQDYFIAFGTESLNGRVIHTDGSITDENGAYLRPANTKISSHSIDRNKLTVKLSKGCAGAQGYDFVISKKSNMLQTEKFSKTVSSTGKPQASFKYLSKGTWYVAARSWVLDAQGNKVYGSWTKIKKIKITVVTPQQPKIRNITVKGNTVTITYTKCKNATGYEILLGNKYKTSAGEKYPVKKHLKRTEGKNTVTVTFTNVKKGTWYVTVRSWNKTSKDKSRVYSPYSTMQKFKTKK